MPADRNEAFARRAAPLMDGAPSAVGPVAFDMGSVEVAVFDFLSHETMHHPFNEGYIRMLRAAFPVGSIVFHAAPGHIERISKRLSPLPNVVLRACPPFPSTGARHNPLTGRRAAHHCLSVMFRETAELKPRLVVVLGVDANLLAVVGQRWPKVSSAPLHLILHGHLGEAMLWRSRNPLIRNADIVAQLANPLPPSVSLVTLELGIKEAIAEAWPNIAPSVVTLEHPVLRSEWATERPAGHNDRRFTVAFLGHARRAKGFEVFADLARSVRRPDMAFDAIGISSPDSDGIDRSGLRMEPSQIGLTREEYLAALQRSDIVCSPLHSRAYDFTASGTISDAIAALKPVIAFRNRTLEAMEARYGPIGILVDSREELFSVFATLDCDRVREECRQWAQTIARIREARKPEALALQYAGLLHQRTRDMA
jgi:glycosyltransferase involved in cell wall biosynthesis